MTTSLGIAPILTPLTQLSAATVDDVRSVLLAGFLAALGGAGLGVIVLCVRALHQRLGRREAPGATPAPAAPTFPLAVVPRAPFALPSPLSDPSNDDDETPTAPGTAVVGATWRTSESSEAGASWLRGFMERLRVALPGIPPGEPAAPPVEAYRALPSPDATVQMDAMTLCRVVEDVVLPPIETRPVPVRPSADATVQMAALPTLMEWPSPHASSRPPSSSGILPVVEDTGVRNFGTFQYGARRG